MAHTRRPALLLEKDIVSQARSKQYSRLSWINKNIIWASTLHEKYRDYYWDADLHDGSLEQTYANILKEIQKRKTLLYRRRYQNQSYHPLPINHPRGDFICWNGGSPPAGKETQQSTFGLKQVELSGGNLNVYPITKGAYIDTIN